MNPNITIVIPTLFGKLDKALVESYVEAKFEVIIVHNNTQATSVDCIQETKNIFLPSNLGFTGACNAGAGAASHEWLLFLNDDCQITPSDIVKLKDFAQAQNLAATQPVIKNPSGDIENIGYFVDMRLGKARVVTNAEQLNNPPMHSQSCIYGLSGACLLIKKDVFMELGMFDERFHSYLEDVDLSLKMHKKGVGFAPCMEVSAVHAHMQTSAKMGNYKQIRDVQNWWRLVINHPYLFLKLAHFIPLLVERGRNLSGFIKTYKK